jgi:phage terminase Nu1 subunit (DNA packaging protein)
LTILIGRKAICNHLNLCWRTVRKWIKQQGLPVIREKGIPPTLHLDHLKDWQEKRQKNGPETQ